MNSAYLDRLKIFNATAFFMRISFILPVVDLSGGVRVVSIYADLLTKLGHDVRVFSVPPKNLTFKQIIKNVLKGKEFRRDRRFYESHLDNVDVDHVVIDKFRPIVDSDLPDADIVIATWWETAEWVWRLSSSKGKKFFFIQHHEVFPYLPIDRVKAVWRLPLQKITISRWLVELAANEYGDPNAVLIQNSVDLNQFYAAPRDKNASPVVGLLYGRQAWKGVKVSLKAIEIARNKFPDIRIVMFGSDEPEGKLDLPEYCKFYLRPSQDRIKDIYSQCDVWLCGSYSEGFHLPPSEAMACRCPVVSTSVGGPMDIIRDGFNGYLSPIGDEALLAANLIKVLSLPNEEWAVMSSNAYQTVASYSWTDAAKLFESALLTADSGY